MKSVYLLAALLLGINLSACQSAAPPDSRDSITQWLPDTLELPGSIAMEAGLIVEADGDVTLNDPYAAQQATLQNSPETARLLAQLAMHDAAYWQAQLLQNPGFGIELMRPEHGGRWRLGAKLNISLLDWLSRHQRLSSAEAQRLLWQTETLAGLHELIRNSNKHWLTAVAARHKAQVQRELLEATEVAADLARLLYEAGNLSELQMHGYASIAAQQRQQLIHAQLAEQQTLSRLRLSSGLPHGTGVQIPDYLPTPPENISEWASTLHVSDLLALAEQQQPALELARRGLHHDEQQLLLAERRLKLRQAGLTLETERESGGERYHGFGINIAPPLFDSGQTELSKLNAQRQLSAATVNLQTLNFGSEIAENLASLNSALQRLQQLNDVDLPRHEEMLRLSLLEYNFMLASSFDLLAIKQQTLESRLDYVDSLFQFWFSLSELERLTGHAVYPGENTHD